MSQKLIPLPPSISNTVSRCYSAEDFQYYIRLFNTLVARQSEITEVARMITEGGIALLDHLQSFFFRTKFAIDNKETFGHALSELVAAIMSKFTIENQIEFFKGAAAVVKLSKSKVQPKKTPSKIDSLWSVFQNKPQKLANLRYELGQLRMNLFEKELMRRLQMTLISALADDIGQAVTQISQKTVQQLKEQVPLCCRKSFTFEQSLFSQRLLGQDQLVLMPGDISQKGDYSELKKNICALLNHKGGVILFGVSPERKVRGNSLLSHQTQQIRNILSAVMKAFKNDQAIKLYTLGHVPIKQRGQFKPGEYVTRVVVYPPREKVLFYWANSKGDQFISVIRQAKAEELRITEAYREAEKKIKATKRQKWIHKGVCEECEIGISKSLKQSQPKLAPSTFKNVFLLIYVNTVKAQLFYNEICEITQDFQMNTPETGKKLLHVIQTNLDFSVMNKLMNKVYPNQLPSGKKPFLANVTDHLQINIDHYSPLDRQRFFDSLEQHLNSPHIVIDRGNNAIFFKDKLEAAGLYIYLTQNSIKARFLGHKY